MSYCAQKGESKNNTKKAKFEQRQSAATDIVAEIRY